jgi:hypothetical protein
LLSGPLVTYPDAVPVGVLLSLEPCPVVNPLGSPVVPGPSLAETDDVGAPVAGLDASLPSTSPSPPASAVEHATGSSAIKAK